jgi:hypothetical protein
MRLDIAEELEELGVELAMLLLIEVCQLCLR